MTCLPNPFLSNSVTPPSSAVTDTAGAHRPPVAPAGSIPASTGGFQEAPAPDALNPHESAGALETDCIGEIFIGAAMFVSRFIPDMHAIVDAMEYENAPRAEYGAPTWDDMPLFLQRAAG